MMMSNKLVASVKVDGKIMREDGETIYLPFGKEYSILLKNLNTVKAKVHIEIDGQEVVPNGLILDANSTLDLERFLLAGNMHEGPKFKFIEKTDKISDVRGSRIEDGIVRISYQFEKIYTTSPITWYNSPFNDYYRSPSIGNGGNQVYGVSVGSSVSYDGITTTTATASGSASTSSNTDGITTYGETSGQKFQYGYIGTLDGVEHAICLQLKGQIGEVVVQKPVTVKRKIRCNVCGTSNVAGLNKFCGECGTNLTYLY